MVDFRVDERGRTPEKKLRRRRPWEKGFLAALGLTGNVLRACRAAGVGRTTAYELREEAPDFRAAWDEALDEAMDRLEAEAWRRAVKGVRKPVYQQGLHVGDVQEYSDTLLIFLLKGGRPEKYRELKEVRHRLRGEVTVDASLKAVLDEYGAALGAGPGAAAAADGPAKPVGPPPADGQAG